MCGRLALAVLLGLLCAAVWAAPAESGVPDGGIRGVVLDTTCYGPCQVDQQPEPYKGSGLTVVVRRLPTGELVRRLSPKEGRFGTRLRPGAYRVIARVADDCWEGEAKRVGVKAHEFTPVKLHVGNRCIV
jgi:hypothetical protein